MVGLGALGGMGAGALGAMNPMSALGGGMTGGWRRCRQYTAMLQQCYLAKNQATIQTQNSRLQPSSITCKVVFKTQVTGLQPRCHCQAL